MPGLLRAAAATAVVAGTAQATRNAVNRHSAEKDAILSKARLLEKTTYQLQKKVMF